MERDERVLKGIPLIISPELLATLMAVVPGDPSRTDIWEDYRRIVKRQEPSFTDFELIERFAFYETARSAYAILGTSEQALYANIILTKGIVKAEPLEGR
jgi:L-fucose mutarotase